jgi:hypothetical protein
MGFWEVNGSLITLMWLCSKYGSSWEKKLITQKKKDLNIFY